MRTFGHPQRSITCGRATDQMVGARLPLERGVEAAVLPNGNQHVADHADDSDQRPN